MPAAMTLLYLHSRVLPGTLIPSETIDACWQLRRKLIDLKPEVSSSDDATAFAADLRNAWRVGFLYDHTGELRGFADMNVHRLTDGLGLRGEYGFTDPSIRRHPAIPTIYLRLLLEAMIRERAMTARFLGDMYPQSYRMFTRAMNGVWLVGEAGAPTWVDRLRRTVIPELYGARWEANQLRVRMRTMPHPFEQHTAADAKLLQRYEALNPDWREGYCAIMAFEFSLSSVLEILTTTLRRQVKWVRK